MSGSGLYVFHTDAGVWGREAMADMAGVPQALAGLSAMKTYLPADMPNWQHQLFSAQRGEADAGIHPFVPIAGDVRGALATERSKDGARQILTSVKGDQFVVVPIDIADAVTLEARRPVTFDVIHPLSGETLGHHTLNAGQTVRLTGQPVLILKGTFGPQGAGSLMSHPRQRGFQFGSRSFPGPRSAVERSSPAITSRRSPDPSLRLDDAAG